MVTKTKKKTNVRGRGAGKRRSTHKTSYRRHGTALPGWKELSGERSPAGGESLLERISTGKFALCVLLLAAALTLYVGHVHATQQLVVKLSRAQQENRRLHLRYVRLEGEFDRATGPAVIYERAHALGLEESVEYGPTIYLDEEGEG